MSKIYTERLIKIPLNTEDKDLLILKSFAEIFYAAYDILSKEQMRVITKTIMESIRKLSDINMSMSFAKNKTGGYALFIFDYKPDGVYRTVQKDEKGFYVEIDNEKSL
jgi:hypothetical protein